MDFLGSVVHGLAPGDLLTGLVYGILKILAVSAAGVVVAGMITCGLCDVFECRRWRRDDGRSATWQLMH